MWCGIAAVAGLVGWSSTAPVRADGSASSEQAMANNTSSAGGGLPSYFDGCSLLSADQVTQATGVAFVLSDTLGPEGSEAATCAYQSNAPGAQASLHLLVYTAASTAGAGVDFSNDANFLGDQPLDPSRATDVPGVGDSARFGPPADGGDQSGVLVAKSGDVRVVLTASGQPDGGQALATAVAKRLLQLLASSPPPPDAQPAPNSLTPELSSYQFGDGRSIAITDVAANPTAVLTELSGDTVTGRNVYFNGFVPPEMDLRDFALSNVGDGRMAVLQFAAPLTIRTTWNGNAVQHSIDIVLRPPTGTGAVALEIAPNGTGVMITDPDGARQAAGPAPVLITGNWAAFVVPKSLGVGADWTAQAVVHIGSTAPISGSTVTGWVLATTPTTVGALTGEPPGQLTMGVPVVIGGFKAGTGASAADLYSPADANSPRVVAVSLDATAGHRQITVTFDRPPSLDGLGDPGTQGSFQLELRLSPPGALGAGPPIYVRWSLSRNASGQVSTPDTAIISPQGGGFGGTAPVTFDGSTMHINLGAAPLEPATPPPTTTTPAPNAAAASLPAVALGGATRRFRLNVDLTPDQCLCASGNPPDFVPGTIAHESVEVVISGTAIALTRQSTGTTAVGAVDPMTGEFEASNSTEFWSGRLAGGLDGSYARLAGSTASLRGLAARPARAEGGGWNTILGDIAAEAGKNPNGTAAPVQPTTPCGPLETYQIYAGHGVYITTTRPPPFALPDPSQGFDQNNYQNNLDFGRALSGRWPPPGCRGASGFQRSALQSGNVGRTTGGSKSISAARRVDESNRAVSIADFAGNWFVGASTRLDVAKNASLITAVQFTPDVRADQLGTFSPLESSSSPTTSTPTEATSPSSSSSPSSAPTAAPPGTPTVTSATSHGSNSNSGLIVVIVVVVIAALAAVKMTRRKRPAD